MLWFFYMRTHINFMCVHKTEAMYERPCINMKGEPHSTSTFTCSITYITSILLYALLYILRVYTIKITHYGTFIPQWLVLHLSWSNWNLECMVLRERGKPECPEKNLPEQGVAHPQWLVLHLSWSNWNLECMVLRERGKPECPEKNLPEQGREPTTNSTHVWCQCQDFNANHVGGRCSPLPHPWIGIKYQTKVS